MRQGNVIKQQEVFVAAAVLAAHASFPDQGFRQRDVRFLVELFLNWFEGYLESSAQSYSHTQILRYLNALVNSGAVKMRKTKTQPTYQLTRLGLIQLINIVAEARAGSSPGQFLFVYYFVSTYKPILIDLVKAQGKLFPIAVRLELEALLNKEELLKTELQRVEKELKKLEARENYAHNSITLMAKLQRQNAGQKEIFQELEKEYPYELNNQKPLSELLSNIPAEIAKWELDLGYLNRAKYIWTPSLRILKAYFSVLKELN